MTEHVARARQPRGKGLRGRAARRRKHRLGNPDRLRTRTEYLT